eukprot:830473-Prorocentrum_minimum.AAC.1
MRLLSVLVLRAGQSPRLANRVAAAVMDAALRALAPGVVPSRPELSAGNPSLGLASRVSASSFVRSSG